MQAAAAAEGNKPPGQRLPGGGTTKITPNPGWQPLKDDQLRGHEAPAVMTNQEDGTDRFSPPPPQPKPKPDANANAQAGSSKKDKGKATADTKQPAKAPASPAPADKGKGKAPVVPEDTRRKSKRPTTVDNSKKAGAPKAPGSPGVVFCRYTRQPTSKLPAQSASGAESI
jgi:hypothetical protein